MNIPNHGQFILKTKKSKSGQAWNGYHNDVEKLEKTKKSPKKQYYFEKRNRSNDIFKMH